MPPEHNNDWNIDEDFDIDSYLQNLQDESGDGFNEDLSDNIWDWTDTSQSSYDDIPEIWTVLGYMSQDSNEQLNPILAYMVEWMSGPQPEYWGMGDINYSGFEQQAWFVNGSPGEDCVGNS